jgi:hypothetical protein
MRQCWLVLVVVVGLGCRRELPAWQAHSGNLEATTSYVAATAIGSRAFSVAVRAPPEHPLFLENCNGAINWGLSTPGSNGRTLDWIVMRDACLSAPIEIEPGATRSFVLRVPGQRLSGPAPGLYQLVILGAFPTWAGPEPLHSPEVAREKLLSRPVSVGHE